MSNNFHLQLYRGTTVQNDAYTGPAGELTVDTELNKIRLHDGSTAGGTVIGGMPTGSIIPFGGSVAPDGYLLCDGSAISRSTYSALFSVIGTTYGAGDGNTTFNLPSLDFVLKGVKGNGMTLGVTDGTNTAGVIPSNNGSYWALSTRTGNYGTSVGTGQSGSWLSSISSVGLATDSTKSGIESDISSNINYIIKF